MTSADEVYADRIPEFYDQGLWLDRLLIDELDEWAARAPDAIYIYEQQSEISVGELRERSLSLARRLRALGISTGDRVAVQLPNWHEVVLLYLAVMRLGAVLVPILPIHRDHEVRQVLVTSGASILVTTPSYHGFSYLQMSERLRADLPGLTHVLYTRPFSAAVDGELLLEVPTGVIDPALPAAPSPDAPSLMVFTSGTEAQAKGCVHTWNTFAFSCRGIAEQCDFGEGDVELVPSPITHTTGLIGALKPLMYRGQVCLMESWDPLLALELIRQRRCTHTMAATVFAQTLVDAFDPQTHDATSLRYFLCGGAPVPVQLVRDFSQRLGGPRMLTMYGQTEFLNGALARPSDSAERVATSDGSPLNGVALRIVGGDGQEVATGNDGEIVYRGPGGMLGYWQSPEATAKVMLPDGWRRTGDRGYLDEYGYLRVTGRLKEVIIRGGMNISVLEIEDLVRSHPEVRDVAVLGIPDERLGERMAVAVVATTATLTAQDLLNYLLVDRRLAKQKMPEVVQFMDELPRTATGKVQRFKILTAISRATEVDGWPGRTWSRSSSAGMTA